MKTAIFAATLTVVAAQANALSCIPPDPIATFQHVAAATESYAVLYGQLVFDEDELPNMLSDNPQPRPITAEFRGKVLTLDGFTADYANGVVLQPSCAGPWCGSANSGVDAVYFVRADQPQVVMVAQPCGGMIFENPTLATLNMLTSCARGGTCTSAQVFK